MKIFLDTANLDEIRHGVELGVVDGVTTNPTLVAKEGKPFRQHILDICEVLPNGVVNAEVVSTDFDGIMARGPRSRFVAPQHRGEDSHGAGGSARAKQAVQRRHSRKYHARVFRPASSAGGKGRCIFRQPLFGPAG